MISHKQFLFSFFIAALGEKTPLSRLTLEPLKPTYGKVVLFPLLQIASWHPIVVLSPEWREPCGYWLLAPCSYPHWVSPFFCLSFLSSQLLLFLLPNLAPSDVDPNSDSTTRCVIWGTLPFWVLGSSFLKWESRQYLLHKITVRIRYINKFRRWRGVVHNTVAPTEEHSVSALLFRSLCVFPLLVWAGQQAWGNTPWLFSADSPMAARRCVSSSREVTSLRGVQSPQDFS